jgi:hypothetical protein
METRSLYSVRDIKGSEAVCVGYVVRFTNNGEYAYVHGDNALGWSYESDFADVYPDWNKAVAIAAHAEKEEGWGRCEIVEVSIRTVRTIHLTVEG